MNPELNLMAARARADEMARTAEQAKLVREARPSSRMPRLIALIHVRPSQSRGGGRAAEEEALAGADAVRT